MFRQLKTLFFITLAVCVLSVSALAQSVTEGKQVAQYDVYAGGVHALKANLAIDQSAQDKYSLSLQAKTYGLLGKMAPWEGRFETNGWRDKIDMPQKHTAATTWRKSKEVKTYSYNQDGSFGAYTVQDKSNEGKPKKVDPKLTEKTTDVLTATLNTMKTIAETGECSGEKDVFDGKRRYTLVFKQQKKVYLDSSRWNVYKGLAIECTAEVKPVAGKWREKPRGWMSIQEQGREKGTLPTIWFAKVTEGQPAVPVKVRVKTSYGTLFMHMTSYRDSKKHLTLAKK